MSFKWHDYNQNHYRAARQIQGYYPNGDHRDRVVGRWCLLIAIGFLLGVLFWGM